MKSVKEKTKRLRIPASVSLPPELIKKTDREAAGERRNRSQMVETALEFYFKNKNDNKLQLHN